MAKLVFNAEMLAKSVDCKNGNEIVFEEYFEIRKSDRSEPQDPKFEYFKKKFLITWRNWRGKKMGRSQSPLTYQNGFENQISL